MSSIKVDPLSMSKQKVLEDLDTLLADLQSTTTGLRHHYTVSTDGSRSVILDGDSHSAMASRISTDSLDAEGQPIYELQSVKPESTCHISSSESPFSHLYTSVQKRPTETQSAAILGKSDTQEPARSTVTLSSNLSELDNLLAELSSSSVVIPTSDRQPTSYADANSHQPLNSVSNATAVPLAKTSAVSATKELDDLMASISDLDIQSSGPEAGTTHGVSTGSSQSAPDVSTAVQPISSHNSSSLPQQLTRGSSSDTETLNELMANLNENMTRQGVSTESKGLCAACSKPIIGQVITALARLWHPEHFVCVHCKESLGTRNFFERDGLPYCERDYHLLFSPRCAFCSGPIIDKCITAMDKTWHPEHFSCAECGCQLGSDVGFHERDGRAYCEDDYYRLFAPRCGGCGHPISEQFITALQQQWHTHCFVCAECRVPFGAKSFYEHEGLPYCETHFHARRGSLCVTCNKPVTGRCVTAMYRKYHPEHFVCTYCQRQLNKGTFKEQNNKPYCQQCFVRLFS